MGLPSSSSSARFAVALLATSALCCGSASAQEVKFLPGKPDSGLIIQALSPAVAPAPGAVRARGLPGPVHARGLVLNGDDTSSADTSSAQSQSAAAGGAQDAGTAPAPAQPPSRTAAVDLEIHFKFNSDQLTNDGKDVLDQLAAALKSEQLAGVKRVILEGHTDAQGGTAYNQTLSLERARSARSYLIGRHDIAATELEAVGKGASDLADPAHPDSEANRRVRVIVKL